METIFPNERGYTLKREKNKNFFSWQAARFTGWKTTNSILAYGSIDFQATPLSTRYGGTSDIDAKERMMIDMIAPSDDELEALADRLPAPPEWHDRG